MGSSFSKPLAHAWRFILTIANAVEEIKAQGDTTALSEIPGWRTLRSDGYLNDKYPGGQENQKRRLEKEGLTVKPRGKKL
jgi:alkylated DNA nucleotide flippase Atl1